MVFISCVWTLVIFVPDRIWWPISPCGSFGRGAGSDWSSDGWLAHCPCSLSGSSALLCHHLFMSHLKCATQVVGESDQCWPTAVSSAELRGELKTPHRDPKLPLFFFLHVLCWFDRKFGGKFLKGWSRVRLLILVKVLLNYIKKMIVLFKHLFQILTKYCIMRKGKKNQLANSGECVERCKSCIAVSITDI